MQPSNLHKYTNKFSWIKSSKFWIKFAIYNLIVGVVLFPVYRLDRIQFCSYFLNAGCKVRQGEGKSYVGTINRAQRAYFFDNGRFADSLEELDIGLPTKTQNYQYQIFTISEGGPFQPGRISPEAIAIATAQKTELKSYSSAIGIDKTGVIMSHICETNLPSKIPIFPDRILGEQRFNCPSGSRLAP